MRHRIACLALLALLAGCDDASDPAGVQTISAARGGRRAAAEPRPLRFLPGSPRLLTYDTTAILIEGRHGRVSILHEDGKFFMSLDIPRSAQFVYADGTPVPAGQPIGVRAWVDSTSVSFEFQPHGSYFTGARPVLLWIGTDYLELEGTDLFPDIWYQAQRDEPWTPLPTEVQEAGRWLVVKLKHFSNYAVAYRR